MSFLRESYRWAKEDPVVIGLIILMVGIFVFSAVTWGK